MRRRPCVAWNVSATIFRIPKNKRRKKSPGAPVTVSAPGKQLFAARSQNVTNYLFALTRVLHLSGRGQRLQRGHAGRFGSSLALAGLSSSDTLQPVWRRPYRAVASASAVLNWADLIITTFAFSPPRAIRQSLSHRASFRSPPRPR